MEIKMGEFYLFNKYLFSLYYVSGTRAMVWVSGKDQDVQDDAQISGFDDLFDDIAALIN